MRKRIKNQHNNAFNWTQQVTFRFGVAPPLYPKTPLHLLCRLTRRYVFGENVHHLKRKIEVFFAVYAFPILSYAQSRGGSCRSSICDFTGGVVGLVLLAALMISVALSISKHGFWRGLILHKAVQLVVTYICIIGGVLLAMSAAYELGGKFGAFLLFMFVAFLPKSAWSRLNLLKSDENNT